MSEDEKEKQIRYLQERVDYLEQVNRLTIDALDLAVSLGRVKKSINQFDSVSSILANASERIQRLMPFEFACFYVVDEEGGGIEGARVVTTNLGDSSRAEVGYRGGGNLRETDEDGYILLGGFGPAQTEYLITVTHNV